MSDKELEKDYIQQREKEIEFHKVLTPLRDTLEDRLSSSATYIPDGIGSRLSMPTYADLDLSKMDTYDEVIDLMAEDVRRAEIRGLINGDEDYNKEQDERDTQELGDQEVESLNVPFGQLTEGPPKSLREKLAEFLPGELTGGGSRGYYGALDHIPLAEVALAVDDIKDLYTRERFGEDISGVDKSIAFAALPLSVFGLGAVGKKAGKTAVKKALTGIDSTYSKLFKGKAKQTRAFKDLAEKGVTPVAEQITTPAVRKAKDFIEKGTDALKNEITESASLTLGKKVKGINTDLFENTIQIKEVVEDLASNVHIPSKKITWQQTIEAAQEMGMNPRTLESMMQTGQMNSSTLLASRELLASSAARLKETAKNWNPMMATTADKAKLVKQLQTHVDIQKQVSGMVSEAGRTLNSMKILAAERANDARYLEELLNLEFGGDKKINALVDVLKSTSGSVKDISSVAKSAVGGKWWNAATELWINSILSGIGTTTVNTVGNTAMGLWQIPERAVAGTIGALKKTGVNVDRAFIGESVAMMYGMAEASKNALTAFGKAFLTGQQTAGALKTIELPRIKAISSEALELRGFLGHLADGIGAIARTPTKFLFSQDQFFKVMAENAELNALAYREVLKKNGGNFWGNTANIFSDMQVLKQTPEFLNKVQDGVKFHADYVTFQQSLGEGGRLAQSLANMRVTKWEIPAFKFIAPFVRTPINIFTAGIPERTPIGLLTKHFKSQIKAGGATADLAKARMATGSAVCLATMSLATSGHITGRGPSDPRQRRALMNTGWRPYSVKTRDEDGKDTYISYRRMEPFSYIVGAMADLHDWMHFSNAEDPRHEKAASQIPAAMVSLIASNTLDKSFMTGMSDVIRLANDPERGLQNWTQRMSSTIVPNILGDISKVQDPYTKQITGSLDAIIAKTPGMAKDLPPRRLWNGEAMKIDDGVFFGVVSPYKISKANSSLIMKEIERLGVQGVEDNRDDLFGHSRELSSGKNLLERGKDLVGMENRNVFREVLLEPPSRVLMGGAVRLEDPYLYDEYATLAGGRVRLEPVGGGKHLGAEEWLSNLVQQDIYKKAPPMVQAQMISQGWTKFQEVARAELMNSKEKHPKTGETFGEMFRKMLAESNINRALLSGASSEEIPSSLLELGGF